MYFSYSYILAVFGPAVVWASKSQDFLANPEKYFRDPCPDERPDNRCTALDEYVWKDDGKYSWKLVEEYDDFANVKGYVFELSSQQWLDESIYYIKNYGPGSVIWKHWVNVWVPRDRKIDKELLDSAILFIDGGSNSASEKPPSLDDTFVKIGQVLSQLTGVIYVNIKQIPNQRLVFLNDWKETRTEDEIIALTWRHFLDYPDQPEWLVRFPMVKACLRAMDMMSEFNQKQLGGQELTQWAVTGASKRGWTSWLTAAVDPERVKMVSPIVLDLINMQENFKRMYTNTGNWSFVMYDYWIEGINGRLDDPNLVLMQEQIDPFFYKDRLTMPKLIVSATGDEFFMPDDTYSFFDGLPEPKYFRLLANAEHSTAISGVSAPHFGFSMRQVMLAAWKKYPFPKIGWRRFSDPEKKTGGIEFWSDTAPKQIYGWVGDTRANYRRDYRLLGYRGNEEGQFWIPDYPELPEGYPDKAPAGFNAAKFKRVNHRPEQVAWMHKEDPLCEESRDHWCSFLHPENRTFGEDENEPWNFEINTDGLVKIPINPTDVQIQANLWRRVMAMQVGQNKWRIEMNEATDAFRGMFFQVQFQGPDDLQSFEFTSELQVIPERPPFEGCEGEACQGALI